MTSNAQPKEVKNYNKWIVILSIVIPLVVAALFVVYKGLKKGIEWLSKLFVPFFLVVIVYLIFYVFSLPGSTEKLLEFLNPDLGALTISRSKSPIFFLRFCSIRSPSN